MPRGRRPPGSRRPAARQPYQVLSRWRVLPRRDRAGARAAPSWWLLACDATARRDHHSAGRKRKRREWDRFLTDLHAAASPAKARHCRVEGGKACWRPCPRPAGIAVPRCGPQFRNIVNNVREADQPPHRACTDHDAPTPLRQLRAGLRRPLRPNPPAPSAFPAQRLYDLLTCFRYGRDNRRAVRPPTPSSAASAKSGGAPDHGTSRTEPAWFASCSPSSLTKTRHSGRTPFL